MLKRFRFVLCMAAAASMLLSTVSYATTVIYADGTVRESGAGSGGNGPQTPPAGESGNTGAVIIQNQTVDGQGPGSASGSQSGVIMQPVQPAPTIIGGGSGSSGDAFLNGEGRVQVDPIVGYTPEIHAQLLLSTGNLTDGFTTNMGAFNSPEDGFCGLKLMYGYAIGDVYYRVFTDEHGWSKWALNELITPYTGDQAKVRAVQVRTKGHTRNLYDVYYRATLNDGTVLDWAHDGITAGALGNGRYIQSLELKLWRHGMAAPVSTSTPCLSAYQEGVVFNNGVASYSTYNGQPYTGWGYDTANNKYYFVNSQIVTGWQYIDGYKYYFDNNGRVVTDLEPVIGLTGDYQIKINKTMKTMTIYTKDGSNGYILPVKVILNTIGPATPIGTFKTYEKYRWKFMHDDIYCQYLLRFKSGFLLHSIIYQPKPDSYSLNPVTYNQLGKNQSDGCVRMTSGDACWVYTNCGVGTTVTIYAEEWNPGPFDRPAVEQGIPSDQTWDPTDPVVIQQQNDAAAAVAEASALAAQLEASTGVEAAPTEIADTPGV